MNSQNNLKPEYALGIIHFGHIKHEHLEELNPVLMKGGITWKEFNMGGRPMNFLDDFTFTTVLALSPQLTEELLRGVATNALWDAIKYTVSSIHKLMTGAKINRVTSKAITERDATFAIQMRLDNTNTYNVKMTGLSDEAAIEALKSSLKFIEKQRRKTTPSSLPDVLIFSPEKATWKRINPDEEIRKRVAKQRSETLKKELPKKKSATKSKKKSGKKKTSKS